MKYKILIVGGTGFLGTNLIKKIFETNFKNSLIYSISKNSTNHFFKKKKNLKFIKIDVTKKKDFKKINKISFNYIFNFGGNIDHKNFTQTNKAHYIGVQNLISELNLKKLILFIQIGSSLEYGKIKSPQFESSNCRPNSIYGRAKLKASNYIKIKSFEKKFKYIILRLYQVYGPNQKSDRLIPGAIETLLKNEEYNCSLGRQYRDFLFVKDFVELLIKIINKKKINSKIYNVGFGKIYTVRKVLKLIKKIIKKGRINFGAIKMRKDEIKYLYPNILKVQKEFNWTPKTNLILGLKKTIKFYRGEK